MPRRSKFHAELCLPSYLTRASLALLLVVLFAPDLRSKDAPLLAIELFDGPNGAAFAGEALVRAPCFGRWAGHHEESG